MFSNIGCHTSIVIFEAGHCDSSWVKLGKFEWFSPPKTNLSPENQWLEDVRDY